MNIELDERQTAIVNLKEGRYSIRAGAGSGKTVTLVERVKQLVQDGEDPNSILCLTFTKDAANEMKKRAGDTADEVDFRTIHSYQLAILQKELWKYNRKLSPFTVMSNTKRKIALKQAIEQSGLTDSDVDTGTVALAIGRAKGLEKDTTGHKDLDEVWDIYESEKSKQKLIDFDDFAPMVNKLLEENPSLQKQYGKKWILVDEAHDTSVAQHRTIELLEQGNLFLISSVEQCIFEFRCASPELIVNINLRYPDIKIIDLETNYRSTDAIIASANSLIKNSKWKSLEMKGTGKSSLNGNGVKYCNHFDSLDDEAEHIAANILDNNTFVLYRTNWYALNIEMALRRASIQYQVLGGKSFFDFSEIIDILSYVSLAHRQNDKESFLRIFNKPNRYFGNKWLSECESKLDNTSVNEMLSSRFVTANGRELGYWSKNQSQLLKHLSVIQCLTAPASVIAYVREGIGYDKWLQKEKLNGDTDNELDIYENLDSLERLSKQYDTIPEFLDNCTTGTVQDEGITIGTIHRSKGLEADTVFVAGVTKNLLPHFRTSNKEEERRLLYVAITRARNKVNISSAFHMQFDSPSPLINEIDY